MDKKTVYQNLVTDYKVSITRTRNVFIIVNVISIIFLVGYFNHRWTWLRHLSTPSYSETKIDSTATGSRPKDYLEFVNPGKKTDILDIREQLIKESLGSEFKFVKINLIGTKIFIDDLPILGGIALLIVMTWFQYVIRREKGITVAISQKIQSEDSKDSIEYLFYGTAFNEIFNTIPGIDVPLDDDFHDKWESDLLIWVRRLMLFAPSILLGLIIAHDFTETFIQTNVIADGKSYRLFKYLVHNDHFGQVAEIFIRLGISIFLVYYSFMRTVRVIQLNKELGRHMKIIQDKFIEKIGVAQ